MEQRAPFVRVLELSRLLETFFVVSIFLTQVILFYTQQLLALGALLLNLLVLTALNVLIGTRQQEARHAVLKRTNVS